MSTQFVGTASLSERLVNDSETYKAIAKNISTSLRVCMPGVIQSFDSIKQVANVDVAIYDRIQPNLPSSIPTYSPITGDIKIPTLIDVPVLIPRAGGFAITLPISAGDECIVVFADMCINEWFDAGGYTNVQQVLRRHNLSDAFAILAPTSQPKKLMAYQSGAIEIRNESRDTYIAVSDNNVSVEATEIDLDGLLNLSGVVSPTTGDPTFSLPIKIDGVSYKLMLQPA